MKNENFKLDLGILRGNIMNVVLLQLVTGMISRIVSKHLLNGQASLPVSLITRDFSIDGSV